MKFLGLRTVIYPASDLESTKQWYIQATGVQPYFDEPFYVGFNVGGYELGLDPNATQTTTYWGVEEIDLAWKHLISTGATADQEIQEVGDGIKVATVKDPLGNVFGIIENPHFGK
ncbi:VOC family protein [Runella sp.]|uniref:VOC family protein n=1 Tax=Runella sp. TaxID=1960881 RepID=UPI003D09D005